MLLRVGGIKIKSSPSYIGHRPASCQLEMWETLSASWFVAHGSSTTFERMQLVIRICQLVLLAGMASNLGYASDAQFGRRFRLISETATRSELYAFFQEMPKGGILHLHSEYAVSPEFWLKIVLSSKPNRYWVRTRTESSCPGTTAEQVLLFSTISRANWERLSECEKGEFKPLPMLSAGEQASWLNSLRVTSVTQGRRQFFHEIVPRLNDLCADPQLMLQVLSEIMREAAVEHVLYLEVQFDPMSLRDSSGAVVSESRFNELLKRQLSRPPIANLGVTVRFQLAAYRFASDPRKRAVSVR